MICGLEISKTTTVKNLLKIRKIIWRIKYVTYKKSYNHRAMVQQKDSNYFSDARRRINFGVPVVKGGQNLHPWLE